MHQYPTMISNFDCKTMRLAVALSGSESTQFGPVTPLNPLHDSDGSADLQVVDDRKLYFRFLVTTSSHPYGFAQTQVVLLRPYMLFTNRLGLPLELRQAGGDQSMTLHPWDWRTTFAFPAIQEPLQLQIRLEGSEWSFPFSIVSEEIMDMAVRHVDEGNQSGLTSMSMTMDLDLWLSFSRPLLEAHTGLKIERVTLNQVCETAFIGHFCMGESSR